MANLVDQQYLETNVLEKKSPAHIVYVTWNEDTFYSHLAPILQSVADDATREVTMVTVSDETATPFCEKYQVLFFPTIFLFRRGQLQATLSGFLPVDRLQEIINDLTSPTTVEAMAEQISDARQAIEEGKSGAEIAKILDL